MAIRIGRMGPADTVTAAQLLKRRCDQAGTAYFLETLRGKLRDDQLATLIEHPDFLALVTIILKLCI